MWRNKDGEQNKIQDLTFITANSGVARGGRGHMGACLPIAARN